jgi:hypothetical protein
MPNISLPISRIVRTILFTVSLAALSASTLNAATTIDRTFAFTDHRNNDLLSRANGWNFSVQVRLSDPLGIPQNIATVTAVGRDAGDTYVLQFAAPQPDIQNFFARVPYTGQRGIYDIVVTNRQGETISASTHALDEPSPLPVPQNLRLSDSTTAPLFAFDPVTGATSYQLRIFDASPLAVYTTALSPTPSFQIPAGLLSEGSVYLLEAFAFNFDPDEPDSDVRSPLENRSINFISFTPGQPSPPRAGAATRIAATGDPTPAGGTFASIDFASLNSLGRVVFTSDIDGGSTTHGLFAYEKGSLSLVATAQELPDLDLRVVTLNDSGQTLFHGTRRDVNGVLQDVATLDDPSPLGGAFTKLHFWAARGHMNAAGHVVFGADISRGRSPRAILVWDGNSHRPVVAVGDPAPGGGTFASLDLFHWWDGTFDPFLNDNGDVVFKGTVNRPGPIPAIFLNRNGSIVQVAAAGDPTPAGGVFVALHEVVLNTLGEVAFSATVSGGVDSVIFRWRNGVLSKVVAATDQGPFGTSYGAVSARILNDNGDLAFGGAPAFGPGVTYVERNGVIHVALSPRDREIAGRFSFYTHDFNDGGQFVFTTCCSQPDAVLYLTPPALPDLITATLTNPPPAARTGTSFPLGNTIRNIGTGVAGASTVRYYLSLDTTRDATDILLATEGRGWEAAALDPGQATPWWAGPTGVTIPSDTPSGSYHVIACADDLNAIAESNEQNNCLASAGKVAVGPPSLPDLAAVAVTNPPPAASPSNSFTLTDTIRNLGAGAAAASTVRYYLSLDETRDMGDIRLTISGQGREVPALAAGEETQWWASPVVTVTIPFDTPFGLYHLLACADDLSAVAESNEQNNCVASAGKVSLGSPPLPDLAAVAVTNPPPAASPGDSFTLTDTIRNLGAGAAGPSTVGYYLSQDGTRDAAAVRLATPGRGREIAALAAGEETPWWNNPGATVTIPSDTANGLYYLLACADDLNAVAESNEQNNCRASVAKVVVGRPAPVALMVTAPVNGTVTGPGIACPEDCVEDYVVGTTVDLTATPVTGFHVATWTGCSRVNGDRCTVVMTESLAVSVAFEPGIHPAWTIEVVREGRRGHDRHVRSDIAVGADDGEVHLAAGPASWIIDDSILYARRSPGGLWTSEIRDGSNYESFELDIHGDAHLFYESLTPVDCWHDRHSGGVWNRVSGPFCRQVDSRSDPAGGLHATYQLLARCTQPGTTCQFVHGIGYSFYSGSEWTHGGVDVLPPELGDGKGRLDHPALVVDSAGTVHIVYLRTNPGARAQIVVASGRGTSWSTVVIDTVGGDTWQWDRAAAIAVDRNDALHIVFFDAPNTVKYATNASGSWQNEVAAPNAFRPAIAVDPNDTVHLLYWTRSDGVLTYARRSGGQWITSAIDAISGEGVNDIVVDTAGRIHIAYYDHDRGLVKYATALAADIGPRNELTVNVSGSGSISGPEIACPENCTASFPFGTRVELVASPAPGFRVDSWTGCSAVAGTLCTVVMTESHAVSVFIGPVSTPVELSVLPQPGGSVIGSGIDCPGDCREEYRAGTTVTLTARPAPGWAVGPWSGAFCETASTCPVEMTQPRTVTATFLPVLAVVTPANGSIAGPGIRCPDDCTEAYSIDSFVTLALTPAPGFVVASAEGCALTTTNQCTVRMTEPQTLSVIFSPIGGSVEIGPTGGQAQSVNSVVVTFQPGTFASSTLVSIADVHLDALSVGNMNALHPRSPAAGPRPHDVSPQPRTLEPVGTAVGRAAPLRSRSPHRPQAPDRV